MKLRTTTWGLLAGCLGLFWPMAQASAAIISVVVFATFDPSSTYLGGPVLPGRHVEILVGGTGADEDHRPSGLEEDCYIFGTVVGPNARIVTSLAVQSGPPTNIFASFSYDEALYGSTFYIGIRYYDEPFDASGFTGTTHYGFSGWQQANPFFGVAFVNFADLEFTEERKFCPVIPEPSTFSLLAIMGSIAVLYRRKNRPPPAVGASECRADE